MHDAEHDYKNSVFKAIGYVKYEFKFFLALKFLTGRWSVHFVGGWLISGQWSVVGWSVGRWGMVGDLLVGGFKETHKNELILRVVEITQEKLRNLTQILLKTQVETGQFNTKVTAKFQKGSTRNS